MARRCVAAGLRAADAPAGLLARARVRELDVRRPDALTGLFAELGDVDVLVNAAGIIRRGAEFDPAVFAEVLDVNLGATMRSCVAAHDGLARRGGCIVNVASMLTFLGGPLVPAYSASKGGIAALTRSLAVAWAPDGIRVNAVAPGWIATELTSALRADDEQAARILGRTPMARWGEPGDVAGAGRVPGRPGRRVRDRSRPAGRRRLPRHVSAPADHVHATSKGTP